MSDQPKKESVTLRFNAAVFVFGSLLGIFNFLLHSDKTKNVPIEGLVMSVGLDAVRYIVVLLISALIIQVFWNRLISDLFPVRAINYQEAIAVVLVPSVVFGS
jgi:hypothetical protein